MRACDLIWREFWTWATGDDSVEKPGCRETLAVIEGFYSTGGRFYHGWQHITEVVEFLYEIPAAAYLTERNRWATILAGFLHDAYDPKDPNAEELSASLAIDVLSTIPGNKTGEAFRGVVCRVILTTIDHEPDFILGMYMVDADLMRFAVGDWRVWAAQIREEYAEHPQDRYDAGRRVVLEKFLAREPFFYTKRLDDEVARTNIRAQLAALP